MSHAGWWYVYRMCQWWVSGIVPKSYADAYAHAKQVPFQIKFQGQKAEAQVGKQIMGSVLAQIHDLQREVLRAHMSFIRVLFKFGCKMRDGRRRSKRRGKRNEKCEEIAGKPNEKQMYAPAPTAGSPTQNSTNERSELLTTPPRKKEQETREQTKRNANKESAKEFGCLARPRKTRQRKGKERALSTYVPHHSTSPPHPHTRAPEIPKEARKWWKEGENTSELNERMEGKGNAKHETRNTKMKPTQNDSN
ncbi:hypothetical protein DXG01_012949 [Tephrocybe rancida]|nr:hypothetical protein DXG01_012949 [Tephrocybe rancida]